MKRVLAFALVLAPLLGAGCSDDKGKATSPPPGPNPLVLIKTSKGDVKAELFQAKAPITVANFLRYVEEKHYDGTVFHRVIPGFMIQGGGYKKGLNKARSWEAVKGMEKSSHDPIKNEAVTSKLRNERGTLAMARTNLPDSATAQFFINVVDNPELDPNQDNPAGYAVFGQVVEGMDVVNRIRLVRTRELVPDFNNVPVEEVVIESIRRVEN